MITRRAIMRGVWRCTAWLAVGFVITVAVSWGLAAWMPQIGWTHHLVDGWAAGVHANADMFIDEYHARGCSRRMWYIHHPTSFDLQVIEDLIESPAPCIHMVYTDGHFPLGWPRWGNAEDARDWFSAHLTREPKGFAVFPDGPFEQGGCEHATGWPVRSLWYELTKDNLRSVVYVTGGLPLHPPIKWFAPTPGSAMRALPFRPIWPGLAIDSVFWGAVAFGVWRGALLVRYVRRRRGGLCPACAYPVGTSPVCTECGEAVVPRRAVAA